jgi:hypothetical protein
MEEATAPLVAGARGEEAAAAHLHAATGRGAAAAAPAALPAVGSNVDDGVDAERRAVVAELGKVTKKIEDVENALASEGDYLGMSGQGLLDYLKGLMKKEEQLREENIKLLDKEAMTPPAAAAGELFCTLAACCEALLLYVPLRSQS